MDPGFPATDQTPLLWQPAPAQSYHATTRRLRYQEYQQYYLGNQWANRGHPAERRLTLNYLRVFVNKAASYLFTKPVGYAPRLLGGGQDAAGLVVAETFLADVAAFNYWALLDLETAVSAGVLGDGAWAVRWDAEANLPRVTQVDPLGLDARWRQDDLRTLLWVGQSYYLQPDELTAEQRSRLPARTTGVLALQEEWTRDAWSLRLGATMLDGGPNPYGVIPYVIFPNARVPGEFWGESDLVDLLDLQREINARLSIFSRILEVSGNPVTVTIGLDDADDLKLGPGQHWKLPEGADAKVLELLGAGVTSAHMEYLDKVYRAMHDVAEMPRTAFGDSAGHSGARSGVALQIELQPLLHKVERKRGLLGVALQRRADLCCTMARQHGIALPDHLAWDLTWAPVLPQDRDALVAQEGQLVGAGIHPPTKAMQLLGDPDPDAQFLQVLAQGLALTTAGFRLGGGRPPGSGGSGGGGGGTGNSNGGPR